MLQLCLPHRGETSSVAALTLSVSCPDGHSTEWFCVRAEEGTAGLPQRWPLSAVPGPWEERSVPELCPIMSFLFSP